MFLYFSFCEYQIIEIITLKINIFYQNLSSLNTGIPSLLNSQYLAPSHTHNWGSKNYILKEMSRDSIQNVIFNYKTNNSKLQHKHNLYT